MNPGRLSPSPATARLEALSGPLQGRVFPLIEQETSIGREPSNQIAMLDAAVSRRHCVIQADAGGFLLKDLESRNLTLVNGSAVTERTLQSGDQIKVGGSVFQFLAGVDASTPAAPEAASTPAGPTVVLRREDVLYLQRAGGLEPLRATERAIRDFRVLLNFSQTVASVRGLAALYQKVLESILEVAPADRVAILSGECESREWETVLSWDRRTGLGGPVAVSRTILRQVREEGVAVLCNDVPGDEIYGSAESLVAPRVRSVLAVPLAVGEAPFGALYLDSSNNHAPFDEDILQLVTALGNVAALALENSRQLELLESENRRLQQEIAVDHDLVGESAAIREVIQFVSRVAARDTTVLIWGESGTGKELVARAIHRNSYRADRPFVAINCAAIPEALLESELFGHEKGAFTGAVSLKKGKLELADGGTVFLDEIGELAPMLQAKLLSVLQEREIERVGGARPIRLDIRLLAATNKDLKEEARRGAFRQDLYYRLNVVSVRMPALRERREDIPLLANYFAERYAQRVKRRVAGVSPKARACLMAYDWPGNVRELENALERALVLGASEWILPEDLPESILEEATPSGEPVTVLHDAVREAKRQAVLEALDQAGGNQTEAAVILGVHPNHLSRLIRTLNLKAKRQRI